MEILSEINIENPIEINVANTHSKTRSDLGNPRQRLKDKLRSPSRGRIIPEDAGLQNACR